MWPWDMFLTSRHNATYKRIDPWCAGGVISLCEIIKYCRQKVKSSSAKTDKHHSYDTMNKPASLSYITLSDKKHDLGTKQIKN